MPLPVVAVDGGWSEWGQWEPCSKSCGTGERTRSRRCENPVPLYGGQDCRGVGVDSSTCNIRPCPSEAPPLLLHPRAWSDCIFRSWANLLNFVGEDFALRCSSAHRCCFWYFRLQNVLPDSVHGGWGEWGDWGACSETCGEGTQKRYRRCDNPRRRHSGRHCRGPEVDTKPCVVRNCEGNEPVARQLP